MGTMPKNIPVVPLAIATALAFHGLRKKSLSPSGGLAAFVIGFLMMSNRLKAFAVSLIVFYLVGSRATKVGKALKATLEEGHQEAGYRTAWQVLCNSFAAFIASLLWSGLFVKNSSFAVLVPPSLLRHSTLYSSSSWCPLDASVSNGWSRMLLFGTLGHFACCLGDTLASELGILSKTPPLLITTLKRVPAGTNGGVSTVGTAASLAGGFIMACTMSATLLVENESCRQAWSFVIRDLLLWGSFGGVFGSLIDSLMGATIQRTRYSKESKRVLQDDTVVQSGSGEIQVVSGLNILTNNQINLLSSIITALTVAYLA